MGCDIHCMLEYARWTNSDGTTYWDAFTGSFNPGRDYSMFDIINGVRGDSGGLFDKGALPEDLSHDAKGCYFGTDDEGEPLSSGDMGDLHSPTWLTCDELAQVIAKRMFDSEYPYNPEWDILLVTMRAFEERGTRTRLLVAYDN